MTLRLARLSQCPPLICSRYAARPVSSRQKRSSQTAPQLRQASESVLTILEERGLVNQIAGDRHVLDTVLRTRKVGFYAGIDPTAPSLHLGHLLPLVVLFWLHRHGHHVVSLVGGATAKVGDPSGRLVSRAEAAESVIQANLESMSAQLGLLWKSAIQYSARHQTSPEAVGKLELLDNSAWLGNLNILQFLKIMGNGMRLGALLGRDTVRNKMENGDGMSFSEFTYPLLQAWDWWQMFNDRNVQVQIGGSDQYGNIIAGIDAVKYIAQRSAEAEPMRSWTDAEGRMLPEIAPMGLTVPLLTTASGEKFGKSAGNAVWLDAKLTTPFDLYGFLLRSSDDDVEKYLKLFTFVSLPEIASVMTAHSANRGKRKAQHLLASEVLELVHGPEEASRVRAAHQAMRTPTLASLTLPSTNPSPSSSSAPSSDTQPVQLPRSLIHNTPLARILWHAGFVPSKSEGARLVAKGGVYIASSSSSSSSPSSPSSHPALPTENSSNPSSSSALTFSPLAKNLAPADTAALLVDNHLILRLGKWKVRVIQVVDDADFDAAGREPPGWREVKDNCDLQD